MITFIEMLASLGVEWLMKGVEHFIDFSVSFFGLKGTFWNGLNVYKASSKF